MDDNSHSSCILERIIRYRQIVQDILEAIFVTERYLPVNSAARVLLFSLVYTFIQILLEYVRTNQTSMLSALSDSVAGIFLGAVLGLLFAQLPFMRAIRIGVAWLALFIVQEFSNLVEGYFFTTYLPTMSLFFAASFIGLMVTFIEALLVGFLFVPKKVVMSFTKEVRAYLRQRSWHSWIPRILAGSAVYFPIYFVFGALISPFVMPYYLEPSMGLRIPTFAVMIPLEFVRGFLYVIALLPMIAVLTVQRKYVFAGTASLLYVAGAFVPFLSGPGLPVQLRIFHGLEILADCLVYGAALAYLFAPKRAPT